MDIRDARGRRCTLGRPAPQRRALPRPEPPPDGCSFADVIALYGIVQIRISSSLSHMGPRVRARYGLRPYADASLPTMFMGFYSVEDRVAFLEHKLGARYLRPGGSDVPMVAMLASRPDRPPVIAVSRDIQARLRRRGVASVYARWNVVDRRLFRPLPLERRGKCVYVYTGLGVGRKADRECRAHAVYGKAFVDEVARARPTVDFVLSHETPPCAHESMPAIYARCFIALRLTKHDGTANMVQELQAMGIPVVHNQSAYGLKWKNVADVIAHIDKAMERVAEARETAVPERRTLPEKREEAIVISSTQYPGYGGAATNAYELIKTFRAEGHNVVGIFFHQVAGVVADPDGIGGVYVYPYKYDADQVRRDAVAHLGRAPTLCLAKNYLAPQYCKLVFDCRTVYLVSGINHFRLFFPEKTGIDVLDPAFQLTEDQVFKHEVKTLEMVDEAINNSKISNDIFRKFYPQFLHKIRDGHVDTTASVLEVPKQEKKYDVVLACSILTRKDKNNLFLIDVLKHPLLQSAQKVVAGEDAEAFADIPNTTVVGLLSHEECVRVLAQSRVLLFPSKFDSNSNTVREAYKHGCLPLTTENIGYAELLPRSLLCEGFEVEEWVSRLVHVLENYNELKDVRIPFRDSVDAADLIKVSSAPQ